MAPNHQAEGGGRALIERIEMSNCDAAFLDVSREFAYGPTRRSGRHGQVSGIRHETNRCAARLRCAGRAYPKSSDGQRRQLKKITPGEIRGLHLSNCVCVLFSEDAQYCTRRHG